MKIVQSNFAQVLRAPGWRSLLAVALLLAMGASSVQASGPQPVRQVAPAAVLAAFPGAEGFGTQTVGGRGGRVIEVTNLNDEGSGSLRAAVQASGPRIVVFRIGGTIKLTRSLTILNPYLTIAGQTAPGDGIMLRDAGILVKTHDVVVRYLRVRRGPGGFGDSIWAGAGAYNVVVDHCSLSWATDENASITEVARNVTFSWNIISEGLANSTHPEGSHSMGTLLEQTENISLHHNLYAHNDLRNPRLTDQGQAEFVNNVVYNWNQMGSELSSASLVQPSFGNFIGNYYKPGPNHSGRSAIDIRNGIHPDSRLYLKGNLGPGRNSDTQDEWAILTGGTAAMRSNTPVVPLSGMNTATKADAAYETVLARAGATLPQRDQIDARVVNEVRNGTGRIIDDPAQVGGWPSLAAGTPPQDGEHDGMPDEWEQARGLNPQADDSAQDRDGDGYSNVEEYINSLTNSSTVPPPPSSQNPIFTSSTSSGKVGTIAFADEDVLLHNPTTGAWSIYFDGSDVLATALDVDAFARLDDGSLLLSFDVSQNISPLGLVDDSDIVRFMPTSLGSVTAGSFAWYFDGSDVDLSADAEDIDAFAVLPDGRLVVSTIGSASVNGVVKVLDEDLLSFTPSQLGETTSGTWALYFDGSDVGLDTTSSEDLNGVWIDASNSQLYLTTTGLFTVNGASGDGADILVCTPSSTGSDTACTFTLYWDGSAQGFAGEITDALAIDKGAQLSALDATAHDGAGDDPAADPNEGPEDVVEGDVQTLFLPLVRR